jgi:hypothetical protein
MATEAPDTAPTATKDREYIPANPGSCTRRLDNLERKSSEAKGKVLQSIAQDICDTFMIIARYTEAGVLQDKHTRTIDNVIMIIRDTDVKQRRFLEKTNRQLRKERYRAHQRLERLTSIGDALGCDAKRKVERLKNELREARGEIAQLQAERDLLREWAMKKGIVAEATVEDADGEFELVTGDNVDEEFEEAVDDGGRGGL